MGFSLKKIVKKASSAVSNVVKPVAKAVEKIAQGKVGEGLGDIGQTAARTGLDIATGGNKNTVDALSGGLMTTAENAARGNTADIARLGITGGATLYGGPLAGFTVNNAFASGASPLQAAFSGVLNSQGGEMSFLNDLGGFLNSNPALSQLANNAISGLMPKSAPKVVETAPPSTVYVAPPATNTGGMSKGMMLGIGAGVIGLVLVMLMVFRKGK